MDLKTKNGAYIVSEEDFQRLHDLKHLWPAFHASYFKIGRQVAEITKIFNDFGKVADGPKDERKIT